jgi:hypothetical protein
LVATVRNSFPVAERQSGWQSDNKRIASGLSHSLEHTQLHELRVVPQHPGRVRQTSQCRSFSASALQGSFALFARFNNLGKWLLQIARNHQLRTSANTISSRTGKMGKIGSVGFLPTDDPEARLYSADIIGYLVSYAALSNPSALALQGDPDGGAYFSPPEEGPVPRSGPLTWRPGRRLRSVFYTNPPLCINKQQLREGFAIIERALEIMDKAVES